MSLLLRQLCTFARVQPAADDPFKAGDSSTWADYAVAVPASFQPSRREPIARVDLKGNLHAVEATVWVSEGLDVRPGDRVRRTGSTALYEVIAVDQYARLLAVQVRSVR